ncbi:hypothetical protein NFI96_017824 [Prochilodus magdalenae]|nr:hypothetical protein NFI96_017824 [Prochilodus magdalenae]
MAPHGKELSEDLKKRSVAPHKDGLGYKKPASTLKLSCSTVARTIQQSNRTGSTQNRPRHGPPKKLYAHTQCHIQRSSFENRRKSAANIAAESVMVWDCMSAVGTCGDPQNIEGTMNANMYCDILKQSMIPSLQKLGRKAIFLHDNVPKHTRRTGQACLQT